jgi:endonuclease/exonuclease/phosphatase (EEP) superfamily protein YafD
MGRPAPAAGPERLRVASWNVQIGNRHEEEVLGVLRGLDAEVVFLLEAYGPWEERLSAAGLPFAVRRPPGVEDGFLVLTRDPHAPLRVPLPEPRPIVEAAVPLGGRTVRVLGVHTSAPVNAVRARRRAGQLGFLARTVRRAAAGDAVAVLGDLNVTPWSRDFRLLLRESGLVDSLRAHGLQGSWPAWGWARPARIPLDHALHTPDLTTTDRCVGPAAGSDHLLLRVTLAPAR